MEIMSREGTLTLNLLFMDYVYRCSRKVYSQLSCVVFVLSIKEKVRLEKINQYDWSGSSIRTEGEGK